MSDPRDAEQQGVVPGRPDLGGGAATPSFARPGGAGTGLPGAPDPLRIGPTTFTWGERTFVMGIVNVTPDSFSGDGLLTGSDPVGAAVERARRMVAAGADILDVGGASSRPGHTPVVTDEERGRVVPVVRAIARALPSVVISVDTTDPDVAGAAIDAGAHLVNDVWGVAADPATARVAAARGVPLVLMHNRGEARYRNLVAEVVSELERAIERAGDAGVPWEHVIVDPGFGFGKDPDQNVALLAGLEALRILGRPILLGTSRKSTLGRLLDVPADDRVEATVATTVLGIVAGTDIVRVHDVLENVRAARVTDAVIRGWRPRGWGAESG